MRYHNITKADMLNGDGLRVVLWVAGCGHHCKECHNPETWDGESGVTFDEVAKQELFEELSKPFVSGITLSGGDPLYPANREVVGLLIDEIKDKFPFKTIWLYTGYLWNEILDVPSVHKVNVVVDGKFDIKLKDTQLHWKGSSNQRVIDVSKSLSEGHVILHSS